MKRIFVLLGLLLVLAVGAYAQDAIALSCTEDYYAPAGDVNDAHFSLTIDGATITTNTACTARGGATATPQVISFSGNWGGTSVVHTIVIAFLNDAYGAGVGDRNLYTQGLTFDGAAATVATLGGGGCNSKIVSPGQTLEMYCSGSNGSYTTTASASTAPPVITTQPLSQTVNNGQAATFSVVATHAPSYQWSKNGVAIAGATSASYTAAQATSADSGSQFSVTVTNSAGSATSNNAVLTVRTTATLDNGASTFSTTRPGFDALTSCATVACTSQLGTGTVNPPSVTILVTTVVSHTVKLNWVASTTPTVSSYNVYRGSVTGGPYSKIGSVQAPALTYTDVTVVSSQTYYYVVTAVDTAAVPPESTYSNESQAVIPTP